jgi:hypothetical protein
VLSDILSQFLHAHLIAAIEIPCFRVMAAGAVMLTALREYDITDALAVHKGTSQNSGDSHANLQ